MAMLIEELMPEPKVRLRHELVIAANPEDVWPAARAMTIRTLPEMQILLGIREVFSRLRGLPLESFPVVTEQQGVEVVRAICGKLWAVSGNIEDVPIESISTFEREGYAKAYWNFRLEALGPDRTLLVTETRVSTYGESAYRNFMRYWFLVRPMLEWSRVAMLREIEQQVLKGQE